MPKEWGDLLDYNNRTKLIQQAQEGCVNWSFDELVIAAFFLKAYASGHINVETDQGSNDNGN